MGQGPGYRLCSFQEDFVVLQSHLLNNGNQEEQAIVNYNTPQDSTM